MVRKLSRYLSLGAMMWILVASLAPLGAQVPTATLTGVVKDATGALVPNVTVRAIHTGTNLGREAVTDQSGTYRIAALNPGPYRLEAEAAGFKKATVTGIVLEVAQQVRVDVDLQVGEVTQTLEVTGTAALVNTESNLIGGVINESRVVSLPLNGRNMMELTTLTAGIAEGTGSAAIVNKRAPTAAGMPHQDNNYQLDGADNKEAFFNSWNVSPSIDAVQEFSVQVGQYSAEFGSGGGAVINVVTKSGSNQFHGTAWEFLRNDNLDARNFFLRPDQTIAPLARNQFGVAAGGRIIKDRMFIFGNYDGTRTRQGLLRAGMVPSRAQIAGNFAGFNKTIRDPQTGQPFPGNVIPTARLDPISQALARYYPEANNPSTVANYSVNVSSKANVNSGIMRWDYRLTNKHDLSARYAMQDIDNYTPGTFPDVGGLLVPQRPQNLTLNLTSIITPRFLNEFRASYGRQTHRQRGQNSGNPIAANAGIPFAPRSGPGAGFVESIGLGNTAFSGLGEQQPWFLTVNTFQWYDGITWSQGKHNIKAGVDIRRHRADAFLGTRLNNQYSFSGQFTGDGFTDFLLGNMASSSIALAENETGRFRRTMMAFYVLDDWKVSPKLTLNIGLRYEYAQIPRELGGLTPSFDPTLANGQGGLRFPSHNKTAAPFYQNVRPDLGFGFLDRETLFRPDKNNFAPRFGFAYRPFGGNKTVVRGGYGIFYSSAQLMNLVQNAVTGPPAQLWAGYVSAVDRPTLTWAGDIANPQGSLATAVFGLLTSPENQWLDGYTQQWSLSIGQEVKGVVLEAQYLGSKGTHLENSMDYNFTTPGPGALAQRRPFPKWDRIFGFNSSGAASYQGLLLTAEKRMGKGLLFKGAYTFSKTLAKNGARSTGNVGQIQDPFNLRNNDGYSVDNVPSRFTGNFIYELPFGRGKKFGANMNRIADLFLGGWAASGIYTAHNGYHLTGPTVALANCNSATNNVCRPDIVRPFFLGGSGLDTPRWDRNAFDWPLRTDLGQPVRPQKFGNAAMNILRNNGINTWDMGFFKNFNLTESKRLEFRTEMFNAFNHTNFGTPVSAPENPNFGRVFGTQVGPRSIQFALKFYW